MFRPLILAALACAAAPAQTIAGAHFHHLHLNATDPAADIQFYTTKFEAERAKFAGAIDAVWADKAWILFNKVSSPPVSDITSTIWHFGWGAEDMKATYQKQLASGTQVSDAAHRHQRHRRPAESGDGPLFLCLCRWAGSLADRAEHGESSSFRPPSPAERRSGGGGRMVRETFRREKVRKNPVRNACIATCRSGLSASFTMDDVNFIIYPVEYARTSKWPYWENRATFDSTKGHVVDHIGISVENLDDAIAKLKAAGVKVTDEPRSVMNGKIKYAFIEGPDKMRIEDYRGAGQEGVVRRKASPTFFFKQCRSKKGTDYSVPSPHNTHRPNRASVDRAVCPLF